MEEEISIGQLIMRAIEDNLSLEIEYAKNSIEISSRTISDISISEDYGIGYISAYCHLKKEQRTFKISRIVDARIVPNPDFVNAAPKLDQEYNPNKPIFKLYGEEY